MNFLKNESKTISGLIVALASIVSMLLVNYAGLEEAEAAQLISSIGVVVGIILAWWGRVKHESKDITWLGRRK